MARIIKIIECSPWFAIFYNFNQELYMVVKGTDQPLKELWSCISFLLKKMPLVCTKNVTFLFFQSSTYNMLKIATFVYFAVIFSWARHQIRGPVTDFMGLAIENFTYFSPSLIPWARQQLHGPVTDFTGQGPRNQWRAHEITDGPTNLVTGPRIRWRAHKKMTEKCTKIAILSML